MWKKSSNEYVENPAKSKQRPASAKPHRPSQRPKTPQAKRPMSAKPDLGRASKASRQQGASQAAAQLQLPHPPPPRSTSAHGRKPSTRPTSAYRRVKHQQQSWENFSDFMWQDVNKEADAIYGETTRPEPMGQEDDENDVSKQAPASPASQPTNQSADRPQSLDIESNEPKVDAASRSSPDQHRSIFALPDMPTSEATPSNTEVFALTATTSAEDVVDAKTDAATNSETSLTPRTGYLSDVNGAGDVKVEMFKDTVCMDDEEPEASLPRDDVTADAAGSQSSDETRSLDERLGEPEHVEPLDLSVLDNAADVTPPMVETPRAPAVDSVTEQAATTNDTPANPVAPTKKPKTPKSVRFNEQVLVEEFDDGVDYDDDRYDDEAGIIDMGHVYSYDDDFENDDDDGDDAILTTSEYVSLELPSPVSSDRQANDDSDAHDPPAQVRDDSAADEPHSPTAPTAQVTEVFSFLYPSAAAKDSE